MAFTRQVQEPGRAALRPVGPAVALPPLKYVRLLDQLRERIRWPGLKWTEWLL